MIVAFGVAILITSTATLQRVPSDTIRLEVGSKQLDGQVYAPHAARVRVWAGPGQGRMRAEWTNVLTLGDSAGRSVQRWVTTGRQVTPAGDTVRWELRQTYDARTLAPLGITRTASTGATSSLRIDGRSVRGTRRANGDAPIEPVDYTIDQPGFVASASDLVPAAVRLDSGVVMVAPVWQPGSTTSELRVFTVLGRVDVDVEGTKVNAWKVEERRRADKSLLATWYLLDRSPYMVYGEVPLPDGSMQRMTEVEIPIPPRSAPDIGATVSVARPSDVASEDGIVAALYAAISGPAGQKREWDRFRSLFIPDARLIVARSRRVEGRVLPVVMTVEQYIAGAGALEDGFFEREISRVSETFGGVTHRFSTYESRGRADDPKPFARGINSIQLLNDGQRWWVVTVLWDAERPNNPIPAKYLPR